MNAFSSLFLLLFFLSQLSSCHSARNSGYSILPKRATFQQLQDIKSLSNIHLLRAGSSAEPESNINIDVVESQEEPIIAQPAEPTLEPSISNEPVPSTTTANASSRTSIIQNPKVQNAIERTGPALIMIFVIYLFIKFTGESGLIYLLIPLMQFGMYKETTGIVENYYNSLQSQSQSSTKRNNFDLQVNIEKWWWFLTVFTSTTGTLLLEELRMKGKLVLSAESFNLVCFGMVSIGLVMAVVGMASHIDSNADRFRTYLGEVASFHFVLIFLIGQSSFWIKTIRSYGIAWLLYPALLVAVNDTMAYVFGVLFGNHKLLPRLSPKKTVEGFLGAALSTIGVSVPLLKLFVSFISKRSDGDLSNCYMKFVSVLIDPDSSDGISSNALTKHAIVMALYASFISPFGGFLASAVKRAHGAKDFGALIPGHGGVVDRFDCQVVTAPFVFLYLKYFMRQN